MASLEFHMNEPTPLEKDVSLADPLDNPDSAFGELDEVRYKAELDLVDRYQLFVAEMLRLSLGGLAIFGFIYEKMFSLTFLKSTAPFATQAKYTAAAGVLLFSICAASALVFRFFATEGAKYYIEALRFAPSSSAPDVNRSKKALRYAVRELRFAKYRKHYRQLLLASETSLLPLVFASCCSAVHQSKSAG
jgi:hypothetical protein